MKQNQNDEPTQGNTSESYGSDIPNSKDKMLKQTGFFEGDSSPETQQNDQKQSDINEFAHFLPEWIKNQEDCPEKVDLHLAQHFDARSGCLSFSLLHQQKEIFTLFSDKRFENLTKLKKSFNLIGCPYQFMPKRAAQLFLEGEKINFRELYEEIRNIFIQYVVVIDERYYDLFCLYVILTYCFTCFPAIPYLWICAEKGSGKTTLLQVFNSLVFHASLTSSSTVSAIFRLIENNRNTLLLDEAEGLSSSNTENREILSVLCSGYQYNGAVIRSEKSNDSWVPTLFNTFGPKILASIGGIREPLASRCIKNRLLRKKKDETTERLKITFDLEDRTNKIKNNIYQMVLSSVASIISYQETNWGDRTELNNRELDIWEPILTLAAVMDKYDEKNSDRLDLVPKMVDLAEELSAIARSIDDSPIVQLAKLLLHGMKTRQIEPVNQPKYSEYFDRREIYQYLAAVPQFSWITSLKALTTYLQNKLGIQTRKATITKGQIRCYLLRRDHLLDLVERYVGESEIDDIDEILDDGMGFSPGSIAERKPESFSYRKVVGLP
jgi:hypothetical protein